MAITKTIIESTAPSTIGKPRIDFFKDQFDVLIEQKGYRVYWEKAIKCACAGEFNDAPLSDCDNCGGTGWVFFNPTQTRMILHSQNINTQYKEWSEEKIGTASITCRDPFALSFMDKITLLDAQNVYSERLFPKEIGADTYAFTLYPIVEVQAAFLFVDSTTALTRLVQGTDFTISNNVITFQDNSYANKVVTIRYIHKPQYYVIDLPRETMASPIRNKQTGKEEDLIFPIHAMVRRSHFVLDAENKAGDRLIDNSF